MISASTVMHIGKEANRFEERFAGLILSEDDFLLKLGDDGSWPHLVIPALKTFETKRVVEESGIAPSTYADIVAARAKPQQRHERILRRVAHVLSGQWLRDHDMQPPTDSGARLSLYLAERSLWESRIAHEYALALTELELSKKSQRGIIGSVQRKAGVSRRRLRNLKDSVLRERVIEALREVMHLAKPT